MANVGTLNAVLGLKTKEFEQGMEKAGQQTRDFSKQITNLAKQIGIAFGVREILQFEVQASKLAGTFEDVAAAFARLNRPDLLQKLRDATQGAVADLELMQQAIMAENFKIPLDVMVRGLEFATIRAKETGQEIDYLVNSFVTGMGRKSIMILDNLGLSMQEIQAETKRVGDFAEAVGIIMERELAKAGEQGISTAVAWSQVGAEFDNLTITLGTLINDFGEMNQRLQTLASIIGGINELLKRDGMVKWMDLLKEAVVDTVPVIGKLNRVLRTTRQLMGEFTDNTEDADDAVEDFYPSVDKLFGSFEDVAESIDQTNKKLTTFTTSLQNYPGLIEEINMKIERLKNLQASALSVEVIREYEAQIQSLKKQLKDLTDITPDVGLDPMKSLGDSFLVTSDAASKSMQRITSESDTLKKSNLDLANSAVKMSDTWQQAIGDMSAQMVFLAVQGEVTARKIIKTFIAIAVAAAVKDAIVSFPILGLALAPAAGMAAAGIFDALIPEYSSGSGVGASAGNVSPIAQRGNQFNVGGNKVEVDGRKLSIVTERGAEFHEALT